jgi:anti-sigma-K factor RskA
MSKRFEDFMKHNREEFDEIEPSADLWSKIEQSLSFQEELPKKPATKTFSLAFVLRVAASVIVVMGIGFGIYLQSQKGSKGVDLAAINPEYAKQQVHYASLVETKLTELKSVAKSDPQLYKEFSAEIAKMDSTYKRLNNDLATSPNQERVLRAMIRNLQIQTEVLNQQLSVIEQFNKMKKDQQNEIKNI